jgi:hypothetical protein
MANITENTLEQTALARLALAMTSNPAPKSLRTALQDINPRIPPGAIEDAVRKIILTEIPSIIKDVR